MDTRADEYRRRAFVAQHRALQASTKETKETFEQIARHWFVLAEQAEWLGKHGHFRSPAPQKKRA